MTKIDISSGWQFSDGNRVQTVTLPHTPQIEPLDVYANRQGVFVYEKTLTRPQDGQGQCVWLEADGVMTNAIVRADGKELMRHYGGYLPIYVDLTQQFECKESLQISFEVDNRDDKRTPPGKPTRGLDFLYYGGMYRNVRLWIKPRVYLTHPLENESDCGVRILTRRAPQGWSVDCRAMLANRSVQAADCAVAYELTDAQGKTVWSDTEQVRVGAKGYAYAERSKILRDIREWNPDDPYLYTMRVAVTSEYGTDEQVHTVGFRQAECDAQGFRLNGKVLRLHGVNRGQQFPYLGIAVSKEAHRREARMLKESGINCIRLAHYPHHPAFLDECDRLGLIVLDPAPGWQFIGGRTWKKRFYENVRDMVKRDRNHACCMIFEITPNESAWATKRGDRYFRNLHELTKQLCPTALTAGDTVGRRDAAYVGLDMPFTGQDKLSGKRELYADGSKKFLTREYGDWGFGGNNSTSRVARGDGELAEQVQLWNFHYAHNANWEENNILGDLIWEGIDHNRGYYPEEPISRSGVYDIFRLPKLSYAILKSQKTPCRAEDYCILPAFHDYTDKSKLVFYSNTEELVIRAGKRELARKKADDGPFVPFDQKNPVDEFYWLNNQDHVAVGKRDNPLARHAKMCMFDGGNAEHFAYPPFTFQGLDTTGAATLTIEGYTDGKLRSKITLYPPAPAVELCARADDWQIPLRANDNDFVFVRVTAVDANGNVDRSFTGKVTAQVEGGELIGHAEIGAEAGIASFLVRATQESVQFRAHSETMQCELTIQAR